MSDKNGIAQIHQDLLEWLNEYKKEHEDLYFRRRLYNNKNRLDKGYYFRGDDNYLVITFWSGEDDSERIYNMNFGVDLKGSFVEFSMRNSMDSICLKLVEQLMEKLDIKFEESSKKYRWKSYFHGMIPVEALKMFVEKIKPTIDDFISKHPEMKIEKISKDSKYGNIQRNQ